MSSRTRKNGTSFTCLFLCFIYIKLSSLKKKKKKHPKSPAYLLPRSTCHPNLVLVALWLGLWILSPLAYPFNACVCVPADPCSCIRLPLSRLSIISIYYTLIPLNTRMCYGWQLQYSILILYCSLSNFASKSKNDPCAIFLLAQAPSWGHLPTLLYTMSRASVSPQCSSF